MSVIDRFRQRRGEIDQIRDLAGRDRTAAPPFQTWRSRTQRLIDECFGEDSKESKDFDAISFVPYVGVRVISANYSTPNPDPVSPFLHGCNAAQALLDGIIADLEDGGITASASGAVNARERVLRVLGRFHRVARHLADRQRSRPPLEIESEYDVQDLLRALLQVDFDDVRPEEPTPSSAGGGSRLDFLLKNEGIVIEVKMVRDGLNDKKLREELGSDITHYAAHPDCDELFCFVYDPGQLLKQPAAVERDLSVPRNDVTVTVVVRPEP